MKYDFTIMERVLRRDGEPEAVPLYEHFFDDQVIEKIMGYDFSAFDASTQEGQIDIWVKKIRFFQHLGFVNVPIEILPRFGNIQWISVDDTAAHAKGARRWMIERREGNAALSDLKSKEYWPDIENAFDYDLFDKIAEKVPEGMKLIGGAAGGPFEHVSFNLGIERLSYEIYENPAFVLELLERVGERLAGIAQRLAKNVKLGAYRFGDDMGYKTATIFSPQWLRKNVLPWQKKVVDAAHACGKPFILHSCGQISEIMDDLIEYVKIDAKHSNEDVIMPIEDMKEKWGRRIALLGGADVNYLCTHSAPEVKEYTKKILDTCARGGGFAIGTGNTVANYIPVENYLALVDTVHRFNG